MEIHQREQKRKEEKIGTEKPARVKSRWIYKLRELTHAA